MTKKRNLKTPQTKLRQGTLTKMENINNDLASVEGIDLFGEFLFKVDAKGRVALPSKFRKALSKDLIVSRNIEDECLYVFTSETFNEWVNQLFIDKFGGFNASSRKHVALRRKLKSRAEMVEIDSGGRINLKQNLRDSVGIKKNVVLIGNTGYFEIWASERYESMIDEVDLTAFLD
jgi:MraZ protein